MIKKFSIYALAGFLFITATAYFLMPPLVVEIPKEQIDREIEKQLPYKVSRLIATVTVNEAVTEFSENGELQIMAEFQAKGLTLEGTGTANISSQINYDNGRFYLTDLKREDIDFTLSENSSNTVSEAKSMLGNLLRRETDEANASGDEERIQNMDATNSYVSTELENDALEALDNFLKSFPVYDLKNSSGKLGLAAMALDDVEILQDRIRVTLSAQSFLASLMAIVTPIAIVLIIVLRPVITAIRNKSESE